MVSYHCRTAYHHNSFFPSSVRIWNNLPQNIKESKSFASFKKALSSHYNQNKVPCYYYNVGSRQAEILHARLRMRCTSLKQHLFLRNIEPDPYCTNCNLHQVEAIEHYLLKCPKYSNQRTDLINSLNTVVQPVNYSCMVMRQNLMIIIVTSSHVYKASF